MTAGIVRRILLPALPLAAAISAAAPLAFRATYKLADALAVPYENRFNPQGLGFDDAANELLFVQQTRTNPAIVRTDLTGTILGSVALNAGGDLPGSFAVSVAADAGSYYFSDYFFNRNGLDLYAKSKTTGITDPLSLETAAYEGTPMDVRGGKIYRTDPSRGTAGHYNGLQSVRVSTLAAPDVETARLDLALPSGVGIGDLTVDFADNALFVLGYNDPTGSVYRFDLSSGALTDTYALGLQTLSAGLAYGNGSLYYYDWKDGAGSTLSVYSLQAVPEPCALAALAVGTLGLLRRRK